MMDDGADSFDNWEYLVSEGSEPVETGGEIDFNAKDSLGAWWQCRGMVS